MKNYIVNLENNTIPEESYNEILDCDRAEILEKYNKIIVDYLNNIQSNLTITNKKHVLFYLIRGIETITNVFINLLCYTKNIELTFSYGEKAIYFYIEFICQITDACKLFLKLTSKDATIYVYKKTIYNLKQDHIKNNMSDDIKTKLIIETILDISKIVTILLLHEHVQKEVKNNIINNIITEINRKPPDDVKCIYKMTQILFSKNNNRERLVNIILQEKKTTNSRDLTELEKFRLYISENSETLTKWIKEYDDI
jgi:hypothetical protein